jgi:hypothetical protein
MVVGETWTSERAAMRQLRINGQHPRMNAMDIARGAASALRDDIGSTSRQKIAMQHPHQDASKPIPPQCAFPIIVSGQRWVASLAVTKGAAFGYRWQWAVTAAYPVGVRGVPQDATRWSVSRKAVAYAICAELLRGCGDVPGTKTVLLKHGLLMVRALTDDEIARMGNESPVGLQLARG